MRLPDNDPDYKEKPLSEGASETQVKKLKAHLMGLNPLTPLDPDPPGEVLRSARGGKINPDSPGRQFNTRRPGAER